MPASDDGRRALGAAGERLTARHLERLGYRIIARNVRLAHGEIDIVAEQDGVLVLVEVRLRRGAGVDAALESISPAKQRRLRLLASEYGVRLADSSRSVRIDVVGVSLDRGGRVQEIRVVPNAVEEA